MGLQSVAGIEWRSVFSVDINLMQVKGRGKEGGREHLVSLFFVLLFCLFQLSNIPLRKKAEAGVESKRGIARKDSVTPQSPLCAL